MKIKNVTFICFLILCVNVLTSQEVNDNEIIAVPDVSTAIGADAATIDTNAIPDFTTILPEPETDFLLTLELPDDAGINGENENAILDIIDASSFSVEGVVGGGFPGYFLGDIHVTQFSETNPFTIQFSHLSQNGLGKNPPSNGYTHSETVLFGDTTLFFNDTISLDMSAEYETNSNGFQSKSPLFYLSANQFVDANLTLDILTKSFWNIGIFVGGSWNDSYLGHKASVPDDIDTSTDALGIAGGFIFAKEFEKLSFHSSVSHNYASINSDGVHRMALDVFANIALQESLGLITSLGIVYEENLHVPVLVPFTLGLDYSIPSIKINVLGGMTSERIALSEVQKKYPFTHPITEVGERAQWFSEIGIDMPVFEAASFSAGAYFEKTAFNQGYLLPNYDYENIVTGLYEIGVEDVLRLDTNLGLSFPVGAFSLLTGWDAKWIDILPEENAHEIFVSASFTPENSIWGAQLSVVESFFEDYVPNISFSAFASLSSSFQLELRLEDFVKLVTSEDRTYAGKYVTNSGFVGLFARLYL